jgi:hypothetical protein
MEAKLETFATIFFVGGVGTFFVATLWLFVVAFDKGLVQGLLFVLIPFYSVYFIATHFPETKRPLLFLFVGLFFGVIPTLFIMNIGQ